MIGIGLDLDYIYIEHSKTRNNMMICNGMIPIQ